MKDIVGLGCLSVSLFFQIKNPQNLDLKIEEFNKEGESYGSPERFQHYLDFVSHMGRKVWQHSGGEEVNVTRALASMGFDAGFVGKVGKDKFGDFLTESLKGIDTSRVRKEGFTGICLVLLPDTGNRSSLVFSNANDFLRFEEIDLAYLNNTRFLHMGSFVGDVSFETQKRIVEEIAPSVKISFRIGEHDSSKGLQRILPFITRSFVIFLNEPELTLLTGKDYNSGAKELLAYGPTSIVCRVGDKGWHVFSQEEDFFVSVQGEVGPEEKTNASNCFVAGFLAGLLLFKPLADCAAIAFELETRCRSSKQNEPSRDLLDIILLERERAEDS